MKKFYLINCLIIILSPLVAELLINEYSVANLTGYTDNYNKAEDWVEIYNSGDTSVELGGYYLSDDPDNPMKWTIPYNTSLASNDYLTFWCSGRNESSGNHHHTNFKLKQSRNNPEHIIITDEFGNIIDDVEIQKTQLEHSMGRTPNGSSIWKIYRNPTKGDINNGESYTAYSESVVMNLEAGFYNGDQQLELSSIEPNSTIYFTSNGTVPITETVSGYSPSSSASIYFGSILITTTKVIKAVVISEDEEILPSFITFNTFFINVSHALPVLSTSANQLTTLLNGSQYLRPHGTIEYFDVDGLRQDFGYGEYNKHGQDSWAFPQRSFDYIARDEMGYHDAIHEKLFSLSDRDEFQRIIIRASGDDNYPGIDSSAHMRDMFIHKLANKKGLNLDMRRGERCVVYANGLFWGVYSIREKVSDADYTNYYYGQDKYHTQYIMNWGNTWVQYGGSQAMDDWDEIHSFAMNNDLSLSINYIHVANEIDVTSLVDYILINSFVVCTDWINWNTSWWRGLDPAGTHQKWGYILWDEDATFNHYINYTNVPSELPTASPCYPEGIYLDPEGHIDLLNKLLENDEFRQYYITRYMDLLNTVFVEDDMIELLEEIENSIALDMGQHFIRWGGNLNEWHGNVQKIKDFIHDRIEYFPQGLNSCYDLTGPFDVTLNIEPENSGQIKINSLLIETDEFPWMGAYHGGIDMKIESVDNYEFNHWELENHTVIDPYLSNISLYLNQDDTIIAVYSDYITTNIVINEINYNSLDSLFNPDDWVELFNPTSDDIEIGNWQFKDENDSHIFTITENLILESGDFIVLIKDSSDFMTYFPEVSNFIGELGFGLSGNGELIRLYNVDGELVDEVDYNDNDPWPLAADGEGPTLELIDALSDNSFPENWAASSGYGTPGAINSVSIIGDVNGDGDVNVVDVVLTVNFILSGEYDSAADINGDGSNNVLDIVELVNIILGMNRTDDATIARLSKDGHDCRLNGNGYIGAIQMTLSHELDFNIELTDKAMVSEYRTNAGTTTLIIVNPESEILFSTDDTYRIEEVMVANSSELIKVNMPDEYSLSHAYPNPFNNRTNIDFNIPIETNVSIKIYNLLGKEITTLIDQPLLEGYHNIIWNADNVASGVYFIKMETSNFISTKKLMLLK